MKLRLVRIGTAALAAFTMALAGCGGGGGGGSGDAGGPAPQSLAAAAAVAANDTATNPTAAFSAVQAAGIPAVVVNSAPKVNFAVFSDGQLVKSVVVGSVSFAIAKLVPGTNGEPDKWYSYVYRTEKATATVGPNGAAVLASAKQATADPKETDAALLAKQLVLNPEGYYTYTFRTDITKPTLTFTAGTTEYSTNGVSYEPGRTHRVAIQLSYKNAAGDLVRVNPYFDFTIGADGKSVAVDASKTRQMVDIATCNNCHDRLALHGGGRVDTQYCVMCHNPGTVDANSGLNLNMATMAHKIHSGRELHEKGENYVIWGNRDSKHDYSEVGFPQPTRNCAACHTAANPKTPQGDNWKSKPTKEACLSCHQDGATSGFYATHVTSLKLGASVAAIANSTCNACHGPSSAFSPEQVHWVQELENAGLYKGVIESVTVTKPATATATGTISVKYAVINPKTGAAYNLTEGCTGAATTDQKGTSIPTCNSNYRWDANLDPTKWTSPPDKFGTFTLGLGINTMAQSMDDISGTAAGVLPAYRGVNDGSNKYTMEITLPAGSKGNARLQLLGSVAERRINAITRTAIGAWPPKQNADLAYVPVKNALYEFNAQSGAASARRQIVSNDNCNSCHNVLGLPFSNEPSKPGFHKGVRNNSETCSICHNANQSGGYTLMTDGSTAPVAGDSQLTPATNTSSFLHESYEAKRFIHGIHASAKRSYPFTHCLTTGGVYNKDGTSTTGGKPLGNETCYNYPGETLNFTAEVAYPTSSGNCNNCHVKDSWKQDKSTLGSVVFKPTGVTNSLNWYVISPKAATCTSCHDSAKAKAHVVTVGTAAFGTKTQDDVLKGAVFETCEGCHLPGGLRAVDKVHAVR